MKQVKNHIGTLIEKNALIDEGEGFVRVKNGLTLTNDATQRNGTSYDINSLDVDEYDGRLFADHGSAMDGYTIDKVIGKLVGVTKKGKRIFAEGIQYAVKESPLALFAHNMTLAGYLTDFSIGTMGGPPDEEGKFKNHSIFEVSQVGIGNHPSARINEVALNSINEAKQYGLDTKELEEMLHVNEFSNDDDDEVDEPQETTNNSDKDSENMKYATVTNSRDFAIKVSYKNAAGADTEIELATNASVDVSEDQVEAVEKQINEAQAPQADLASVVENAIATAVKPLQDQIKELEQNKFDKDVKEPAFTPAKEVTNRSGGSKLADLGWRERTAEQVNSAWASLKGNDQKAGQILTAINSIHLEELQKDGIVPNSMTIADFGNFVISREMLSEIQGCRNDYTALVDATPWRETLSTQMAWLKRSGDIDMTAVEFCDDDADGNLKPISEYTATVETANLEELAAVTPVCNAATRFLAADLLGDVAAGYRNDYDRKRAQLVVARLEQAVDENGNSVVYDINPQIGGVTTFLDVWMEVATCTPNGTFIMSVSSYAEFVKQAVTAGISGPLAQLVTTGNQQTIFGRPYILVPDDLMPKLNTAQTKTFVVDGGNVTINHAVFYARPENFTGRTSGGLQYDLSTDAAYEVGDTVKSAYQRNELVLRGSFFRGGAILDTDQVSGILSPGLS